MRGFDPRIHALVRQCATVGMCGRVSTAPASCTVAHRSFVFVRTSAHKLRTFLRRALCAPNAFSKCIFVRVFVRRFAQTFVRFHAQNPCRKRAQFPHKKRRKKARKKRRKKCAFSTSFSTLF